VARRFGATISIYADLIQNLTAQFEGKRGAWRQYQQEDKRIIELGGQYARNQEDGDEGGISAACETRARGQISQTW
jgi:glutathione peroxidase-family protein